MKYLLCIGVTSVVTLLISKTVETLVKAIRLRTVEVVSENASNKGFLLLSCPCCGKDSAELVEHEGTFKLVCSKNLKGCGLQTSSYKTPTDAINSWNTRNGLPNLFIVEDE